MDDPRFALTDQIPRLRRYARALTGDRSRADELVQDCLERALSRRNQFQAGTNLRAWLFAIMHSVYANQARRFNRTPAAVPYDLIVDNPGEPSRQANQIDYVAAREIAVLLRQIPIEQRQVVVLVGLEGMSYREAASVLSLPIGTIMSRLARGRERLRELASDEARAPGLRRVKG